MRRIMLYYFGAVKPLIKTLILFLKMSLIKKSILSFFHLLFLSIAVYTRAADTENLLKQANNGNTVVRYISELLVIIICILQLFFIGQQIYGQGMKEYLKNLVSIFQSPWIFRTNSKSVIIFSKREESQLTCFI